MSTPIFCIILKTLFIIIFAIGVVVLYLVVKNLAYSEMGIELPPKVKPQESYWETFENGIVPTYACHSCNYESEWQYRYCPWCGKKMYNYNVIKK